MRVLLVDHTMLLQRIHGQMLSDLGAAVEIAGDGSLALAMFTEGLRKALPSWSSWIAMYVHFCSNTMQRISPFLLNLFDMM